MIYTCKSWLQMEEGICKYLAEYTPTLILQTYLKDTGKLSILWTGLQQKLRKYSAARKFVSQVTYSSHSLLFLQCQSGTTIDPLYEKGD